VNDGTLKGVELKNMKVPFAGPECDPQITPITRINCRKKAQNTQRYKR